MSPCAVCDGGTQPAEDITATYGDERYELCSDECKTIFESAPARFAADGG